MHATIDEKIITANLTGNDGCDEEDFDEKHNVLLIVSQLGV